MSIETPEYNTELVSGTTTELVSGAGSRDLATLTDRIAKLRAEAANCIELWQPEPGESLIGVLVGSKKEVGVYGENYQILIKDETGKVTAAWLTLWLRENLRAQGADKGDLVAITFLGKKQSPTGRTYNAYSLVVDKTNIDGN